MDNNHYMDNQLNQFYKPSLHNNNHYNNNHNKYNMDNHNLLKLKQQLNQDLDRHPCNQNHNNLIHLYNKQFHLNKY
jgi:hypothetical protein